MGSHVLLDVTSYIGGFNFTTKMNSIALSAEAEELESTTFGNSGFRERKGGLKDVNADLGGYWDDEVDSSVYGSFGVAHDAVSISPTGVEGDTAFLWRGEKFTYTAFGEVGQLTPFSVTMTGSYNQGVSRGTFLKKQGNVSSTGATGTAFEIPAGIASGFSIYSHFHVFTAGTTVTAVVESDADDDFASATTRATHGSLTTVGSNVQKITGPITDTWFRVRVTGITGTFSVACAIGVGI
jgi:hypothetical protein